MIKLMDLIYIVILYMTVVLGIMCFVGFYRDHTAKKNCEPSDEPSETNKPFIGVVFRMIATLTMMLMGIFTACCLIAMVLGGKVDKDVRSFSYVESSRSYNVVTADGETYENVSASNDALAMSSEKPLRLVGTQATFLFVNCDKLRLTTGGNT